MHKKRNVFFLILLLVFIDQALKIYIKTHFELNHSKPVFGQWFQLFFVENPGMAYGLKFGGSIGKVILTVFRLLAVIVGFFYINRIISRKDHAGFILCVSLIFAGALGNLIDSCFYGMIFNKGMLYNQALQDYTHFYDGLATFAPGKGYAGFLHGNVVDMLYFPILKGQFPTWFPVWGGEEFEFFRPVFNFADAAISGGVIALIMFNHRFVKNKNHSDKDSTTSILPENSKTTAA